MQNKIKGFTLIELIVVMGIITILSSILVPNYLFYVKRANTAKAEQVGRMIYTSSMRAYSENDNFNAEDVALAVKEDVNIDGFNIKVNEPSADGSSISINFSSDSSSYFINVYGKDCRYSMIKER